MVDNVLQEETWGGEGDAKHRKKRGCKTRKEEVEDRETTDLSGMESDWPIDSASPWEFPIILMALVSTTSS